MESLAGTRFDDAFNDPSPIRFSELSHDQPFLVSAVTGDVILVKNLLTRQNSFEKVLAKAETTEFAPTVTLTGTIKACNRAGVTADACGRINV
jgi:hypothetical protein